MKKFILLFAVIMMGVSLIFAQGGSAKTVKSPKLVRDKFDPARSSAADLKVGIGRAQREHKRIMLDVGGEWCSWCRLMDNYFIKNPKLMKILDRNFVWIKINMSEENENKEFLSAYPEIPGYPHIYVLETDGKFLFSKSTSELEQGKSYNLMRFTRFLNEWVPAKH